MAATSSHNAWAVGVYEHVKARTVIEHWNGKAWKVQPSPNPRSGGELYGVAATSSTNAWAVGSHNNATGTLIEHWNGKAWKVQASPNPRGHTSDIALRGVAATSSTNAWAVGNETTLAGDGETLIEHWNGKAWKVQPSPYPGFDSELTSVAATSATNAWAVGNNGFIEHWNGKAWNLGPSNRYGYGDAVAATSPTNAWAVGFHGTTSGWGQDTLIEHWNGTAWQLQASPNPGSDLFSFNGLDEVSATSPTNAWAVGTYTTPVFREPLIEHWNGATWQLQASPKRQGQDDLRGVATTSPGNAWAVGFSDDGPAGQFRTLALHCS